MMKQETTHPLAPEPVSGEPGPEPTDNDTQTVRVRSGVKVGTMRYVLIVGMILALVAVIAAYVLL